MGDESGPAGDSVIEAPFPGAVRQVSETRCHSYSAGPPNCAQKFYCGFGGSASAKRTIGILGAERGFSEALGKIFTPKI
jgi:hypothetical protein